mmetsp:Transcript_23294/g.50926  ORF Transcript_23294/g.50926 Transcript_23294/m.50926 type:complete len:962 (-) Transcript_23294:66-2951(-)
MSETNPIKLSTNDQQQQQQQQAATVTQPSSIEQATLRPYQLKGLEFMVTMHRQNLAMILGDEMGLGKTLQTISLLCHLKETEGITGPSLIICPLSVLSSWSNEMTKWAPSMRFLRLHASNAEEQLRQKQDLALHCTEYDVILTTYEMAKVPGLVSFFQRTRFHYLVLDEGHKIKGHETIISKTVRKFHAGNRLLLTGTPLQNNLVELWSLLNFLYPEVFTVLDPFRKHFDLQENIIDKEFLAKTQKLLEIFMLRRLKQEVEKLIPEKLETKVYCPLSKSQTFWYKSLLMKDVAALARIDNSNGNGNDNKIKFLRNLFMQLRKCSNHPFLFDGAEINPDQSSVEDLVGGSGKLAVLDMLLMSLFQNDHRAVLFTQFTSLLNIIEDYCLLRGWKYCRLDGSTARARRNYLLNRFNEPNSPYFLFLMSTRSGGMGLNLQTADTCILFDSDWNPQSDIQAMARVHRIGQKNKVHIYRLVTAGTVEERMLERAEAKLMLEMVNKESKIDSAEGQHEDAGPRGMSAGELWEDIKFGCGAVFGDSSNNALPSEQDIASITNRTRKESDSVGKLTGGISKSTKSFDPSKKFSDGQLFNGVDFRSIRAQQAKEERANIPKNLAGIAHLWNDVKNLEDKKRERKSRILQIKGKGSGYGCAFVPVLAANNYDYGGETSVFDRELKTDQKSKFVVRKKEKAPTFEHLDHCLVCGEGGSLVCCPQCPNTLHLKCAGLRDSNDLACCSHHTCVICGKKRNDAGGLLYPCQSCPNSFCEDHLPKEGVTYLDEGVEHFEKLGFNSTKYNIYINCSPGCEQYAVHTFGYVPTRPSCKKGPCPAPMDVSDHFGTSYDLSEAAATVEAEKGRDLGRGKRRGSRQDYTLGKKYKVTQQRAAAAAVEEQDTGKTTNTTSLSKTLPSSSSLSSSHATSATAPLDLYSSSESSIIVGAEKNTNQHASIEIDMESNVTTELVSES